MKKEPTQGPSRLASTRLSAGLPSLVLLLFCGALVLAFFFFSSSPASAAFFATLTPTQENHWAFVDVAKPTYTPAPISTPVPTLIPSTATEVRGVMDMQVLENTAVPSSFSQAEVFAPNPGSYSGAKYILVDLSEQHMYVYDGDSMIYSFVASTGINNATRVGTFAVQSKIPNAYGSTWNIWMPNWLGIYWAGGLENGIHALPILPNGATLWEGYLGRPVSSGCVVLGTYEAGLLYDWAEIGTTVEIRW
jgi:lipoprotein-anchoring transpeptidase ErfK/SrfK